MKKIFMFMMAVLLTVGTVSAQYGPTKFTDNVSVGVKGGVTTPMLDMYHGVSPVIGLDVEKYVTPWLGFGIDANTLVANPYGESNPHTMFDLVNVNMVGKINLRNLSKYDGTRKFFEPVLVAGIGWGHRTCSEFTNRNYMVSKAGVELNFNLGEEKAWAVRVTPAAVWGPVDGGRLDARTGGFEVTAGVVYHFKNKDGNRHFTKIRVYNQEEVDMLNEQVNELRARNERLDGHNKKLRHDLVMLAKKKNEVRVDTVYVNLDTHKYFKVGSAELISKADVRNLAQSLDKNTHYLVLGYASEEGSTEYNQTLSEARAKVVYDTLIKYGFPESNLEYRGEGETTMFSTTDRDANRVTVVKQK